MTTGSSRSTRSRSTGDARGTGRVQGAGRKRGKGTSPPSRGRSILVWSLRALALAIGVWLGYEAWRFPNIAELASRNPERTSFMVYREQEAKAAGKPYRISSRWIPLARISLYLQRAVILAEDQRFYQHHGFDSSEIRDALEDHLLEGKRLRGASTISQQLAKNLWLGPERSLLRKAREAVYTWALERRLSKDRILEIYLNVAEWGPGVFGAEAASERYYHVSAANLRAEQAASLAVALPNPLARDPSRLSEAQQRRARRLLAILGVDSPPARAPAAAASGAAPKAEPSPPRSVPQPRPTAVVPRPTAVAPKAEPSPPRSVPPPRPTAVVRRPTDVAKPTAVAPRPDPTKKATPRATPTPQKPIDLLSPP